MASEVSEALTRQPGLAKGAAANTAQIVAAVAAAVVGLPAAQQKRLKSKSADFADMIAAFARDDVPAERIIIPEPTEVEPRKGSGFGKLIDVEEGGRQLSAYATKVPLEEWAGPVAGSSALHDRGIARSTLHDWQKRGQVVALLVGARKHAFPLEQFVDARPVEGIADVLKIVGNPRRAWLWLVQHSPLLAGKRPIDLLKQDRKNEVVEAARTVFEYL
ncbi:antitoxin Xre/MbcA/ParS toxin-binding domain-containing protein [Sphingopyxis sp. PET50]|uniref:antitoxin Xre/MbcA/ParS-like domain-containing protein n=1 Tax=Sphingopyxis sp. PET50 TaxID=2976533 RepID=UPI0021B02299|nr:antitoxin Xre/MbcA/ParS toxin-binding domain-containing protein [Sphingopyxis sp. PET50]